MSKDDPIFNDLLKHNLITKDYDPQANKNSFALTPKGADWYRTLASLFAVPKKSRFSAISFDKVAAKVNKNAPDKVIKNTSKATINKYMNKGIDIMEGIAKFGQSIDKQTGGKPKLTSFQQGEFGGTPMKFDLSPPTWSAPSQQKTKKKRRKRKVKRHAKAKTKR